MTANSKQQTANSKQQTANSKQQTANSKQYIPEFDFIKGIATISVILLHVGIGLNYASPYWIGRCIPLFVCVSCALNCLLLSRDSSIKRYFEIDKLRKVFVRIFFPFVLSQILLVTLLIITGTFSMKSFFAGGGIGPGSYYPWVYLQLWVVMPFMFLLIRKNFIVGSFLIVFVSIIVNIIFSVFSSADWFQLPFISHKREAFVSLYRLCVNRYLFIYPLVFLLVEKRITYSILLFCGFMSAGYMYSISYRNINLEPFIFNSGTWQVQEYPSVFYTVLVFIFLYKIYGYIPEIIQKIICRIGSKSWEVFNFQMIYFTFSGSLNINKYLYLVLSLCVCIIPIYSYKFMEKPLEIK